MSRNELDERIETYTCGCAASCRASASVMRRCARRMLKLRGWVANLEDGTVEAMIQPGAQIDRMLAWLRHGPPAARVTEVTFEERKTEKRFERFQQQ